MRTPLSPLGSARVRLDASAAFIPAREPGQPELDVEEAFLAHELASFAPALSAAERRAFEALVARLLAAVGAGSTRVPASAADRALLARVPELCGPAGAALRPLVLLEDEDGFFLASQRLFAAETRLGAALVARLASPALFAPAAVTAALASVSADAVPRPSGEQQSAVARALTGRLGVITGGPGTGKTTIVLTLVRTLVHLGVDPAAIALAAPTGKAANRLGEAVREGLARVNDPRLPTAPPAETLHRLLRHSPSARGFAHGEGAPLPHAAVIVDESSMIDLSLMDRLVAAVAPGAILVLLGDADQLPSVEAGTVFRDLARLGLALGESHRMDPRRPEGRRILELAGAVRAGAAASELAPQVDLRPDAAALTFAGAELVPAAAREALLARWWSERIDTSPAVKQLARDPVAADEGGASFPREVEALLDEAFAHHQRHRLLAITRARPTGVDALNALMHARFGARGAAPVPGEPLLMLRNDYDRGLWNGDQGLVVAVRAGGQAGGSVRRMAAFKPAGRWTAFPLESLRDSLDLAFALTVHKAQGSEFDDVALVLPERDHPTPLFSRDLLYTAITRARRSVVLCGELAQLAAAVAHAQARSSGLARRLQPR